MIIDDNQHSLMMIENWYQSSSNVTSFILGYLKVFNHDTAGGLYTNYKEVGSKNPSNPNAHLHSILNQLEQHREYVKGKAGYFRFKLCYPERKVCNEWLQSSNPYTDSNVKDVIEYPDIPWKIKKNSLNKKWNGLGKNVPIGRKSIIGAFIDDAPQHGGWYCAIGAKNYIGRTKYINGPYRYRVTKVQLYVMPVAYNLCKYNLQPQFVI